MAQAVTKQPVPTDKQRAVLDAFKGGRVIEDRDTNGKKTLTVLGPTGKPVKEQPKMLRTAFEAAVKRGWIATTGGEGTPDGSANRYAITDEGTKAKRRK